MNRISVVIAMLTMLASSLLLIGFQASAQIAESEYQHQTYLSPRVMGMGGAFTAVADDYTALYYNPAGLARLKQMDFDLGVTAGGTPAVINFYNDLNNAGSNTTQIQNVLQKYFGYHFGTRMGVGGVLAEPHWAIGIQPIDATVEADIHATTGTTAGVEAIQDSTVQFGYALSFFHDSLSVGIAPKAVYRGYYSKDLDVFDLATNNQIFRWSDFEEGITGDVDFGLLYTFDIPDGGFFSFFKYAKPTIGVAVDNIVDSGFKSDLHLYNSQSTVPTYGLERRFNVGTKFELPEFWVFKPRLAVDGRDMGTRYANFNKCFRAGTELLWTAFSWLKGGYRMGLYDGNLSLGLSAQLSVFLLDFASYTEDVGTEDSPRADRRYLLRLSMDF